jgi:hypothetical protein
MPVYPGALRIADNSSKTMSFTRTVAQSSKCPSNERRGAWPQSQTPKLDSHIRNYIIAKAGKPETVGLPRGWLDGDRRAIELGECKATEGLVVGLTLVPQNADRDRFAEQQSLLGIRAPVHARHVTT